MVTTDAHEIAVNNLIDSGVALEEGDEQRLISNTDAKVTVYSTLDGEPREILKIDSKRVLNKRLPNGRPAFWMPGLPGSAPTYTKGEIRCYLDPEFDETDGPAGFDRSWVDSVGLRGRTCNMMAPDKNNQKFRSLYDRDDHAAKKHRNEWKTIQDALQKQRLAAEAEERRLDREAQMAQAQAIMAMVKQGADKK